MAENEVPMKTEEAPGLAPAQVATLAPAQAQPPEQAAILTTEEFSAALDQLFVRAKAAGVRPLQVMAMAYAKQGMAVLGGLLAALEEGNAKKPPAEAPDAPTKKEG